MIPNMYKIAGELLPGVFHVTARAIASHALSIFGDHSDVMAARQTGFALLASGSVQEVMDLGWSCSSSRLLNPAFLSYISLMVSEHHMKSRRLKLWNMKILQNLVDYEALEEFRNNALNPEHPVTKGTAQNPDIFFQASEASNKFYDAVPDIVAEYMKEIS